MTERRSDFEASLRTAAEAESRDHPSVDDLETYHWGDLRGDREKEVEAHLALCAECLELLNSLDRFEGSEAPSAEAPEPTPEVVDASLAAFWRRMWRSRYERASQTGLWRRFFPPPPAAPGPYISVVVVALVAMAAWLVPRTAPILLEARIASLEAELAAGEPNPPIVEVSTVPIRGDSPGVHEVSVGGHRRLTLVLHDPQERVFSSYSADITNSRGQVLQQITGLERTRRKFVVAFSTSRLTPGNYTARLWAAEEEAPLAVYPLRLTP